MGHGHQGVFDVFSYLGCADEVIIGNHAPYVGRIFVIWFCRLNKALRTIGIIVSYTVYNMLVCTRKPAYDRRFTLSRGSVLR